MDKIKLSKEELFKLEANEVAKQMEMKEPFNLETGEFNQETLEESSEESSEVTE